MARVGRKIVAVRPAGGGRIRTDAAAVLARLSAGTGRIAVAAMAVIVGYIVADIAAKRGARCAADTFTVDARQHGLVWTDRAAATAVVHVLRRVDTHAAAAIRQGYARSIVVTAAAENALPVGA